MQRKVKRNSRKTETVLGWPSEGHVVLLQAESHALSKESKWWKMHAFAQNSSQRCCYQIRCKLRYRDSVGSRKVVNDASRGRDAHVANEWNEPSATGRTNEKKAE